MIQECYVIYIYPIKIGSTQVRPSWTPANHKSACL